MRRRVTEIVPWFHFSPNVALVSPTSYVNQERLLSEESLNGFAWYEVEDEELLYRNEAPYTGWRNIPEGGFTF